MQADERQGVQHKDAGRAIEGNRERRTFLPSEAKTNPLTTTFRNACDTCATACAGMGMRIASQLPLHANCFMLVASQLLLHHCQAIGLDMQHLFSHATPLLCLPLRPSHTTGCAKRLCKDASTLCMGLFTLE